STAPQDSCADWCVDRRGRAPRSRWRESNSGRADSSPRSRLTCHSFRTRSRELGIDLAVASTDVLPPPCPQHMFTSILSESLPCPFVEGQLRERIGQFSRISRTHARSRRLRNQFPQSREVGDDDRSCQPHGFNGLDRSDQTTYRLILPRDNDSVERELILNRLPLRHPSGEDRVVAEHSGSFTQLRQSDTVSGDE